MLLILRPSLSFARRSLSTIQAIPKLSYVEHPYDINTFKTIDPLQAEIVQKFAVVELSGTQYKISENDTIIADKMDFDIGEQIELSKVLLVGSKLATYIGRPYIENARVKAIVEEKLKNGKVIIFKKRRRKNTQKLNGFRRQITILRIIEIIFDPTNITSESN